MNATAEPARTSADDDPVDAGFTLVEVLVALGVFSLLATVLLGFVFSTAQTTDDVDRASSGVAEARLALERMGRELRQAEAVESAQLGADTVSITFWTDFNGNGIRDLAATDPEVLTYRWTSASKQVTLTASDPAGTVTRPVLAGGVTSMDVRLRSSLWQHDGADGSPVDGTTTWQELDAAGAPVGNGNGVPDGPELKHIDLVSVRLRVATEASPRDFTLQADLRNREVE